MEKRNTKGKAKGEAAQDAKQDSSPRVTDRPLTPGEHYAAPTQHSRTGLSGASFWHLSNVLFSHGDSVLDFGSLAGA